MAYYNMSQSLRGYSNRSDKKNAGLFVNVFGKATTFIAKLIQLYTRIPLFPYSVEKSNEELVSMWLLNKKQTPHKRNRQSN